MNSTLRNLGACLLVVAAVSLQAQPADLTYDNTCAESSSQLIAYGELSDNGALLPTGSYIAALDESYNLAGVVNVVNNPGGFLMGSFFVLPINEDTDFPDPPCGTVDAGIDGCGTAGGCEMFTLVLFTPGTGPGGSDCYSAILMSGGTAGELQYYPYVNSDGDIFQSIDGFETDIFGGTTVVYDVDGDVCYPTLADLLAALPVELTDFRAMINNQFAELSWTTATEVENDMFVVERSTDGRLFEEIGSVDGAGNSDAILNYNFMDRRPVTGTNFYRLKQIDFDGTFAYSAVVPVDFQPSGPQQVSLFPNPTQGQTLTVSFEGEWNTSITTDIRLFDVNGRQVGTWSDLATISQTITLPELPAGMYQVVIESGTQLQQQRLIVR